MADDDMGTQSPMNLLGVDPQLFVVGTIGGLGCAGAVARWAIVKAGARPNARPRKSAVARLTLTTVEHDAAVSRIIPKEYR